MGTVETVNYAEAWLGRTLGTIKSSVSSHSSFGAHPAFFLPFLACWSGRDFFRKVAFEESANHIGSNVFWWAVREYKSSGDFLLVAKEAFGVLGGVTINDIRIVVGQMKKINCDFLIPMVCPSCGKVWFQHLVIEVDSPHKQIIIIDAFRFLYGAIPSGDFHEGIIVD